MVLQNYNITAFLEFRCNLLAQFITSRQGIFRHANLSTGEVRTGSQPGTGDFPYNTESDQGRGMGMDNGPDVRAFLINLCVEGKLD
jgi:hypothetical protein